MQKISITPMTIIHFHILFLITITLSGFAIINNAVAQEDVIEIEDKPIPIDSPVSSEQTPATFIHSWWFDGLLVSSIAIAGSFVVYFVINYFLKRTAESLRLDKGDLKGIRSIIKMIIIVIICLKILKII